MNTSGGSLQGFDSYDLRVAVIAPPGTRLCKRCFNRSDTTATPLPGT